MARIRTIKPEFWTDEKIVELTPWARLLFLGLLNFADDAGRLVNSPRRIKMQILPADDVSIPGLLTELLERGLIHFYTVDSAEYIQIANFNKHQKINHPSKTTLPGPAITEDSGSTPGRKGMEGNGIGREVREAGCADRFPDFWKAYPRKVKRKAAEKLWKTRKAELDPLADSLLEDIRCRLAEDAQWKAGF